MRFRRHGLWCPMGGERNSPPSTSVVGGLLEMHHWRTVGTGYPLVRLLASRACLRFTRRVGHSRPTRRRQEQVIGESDGPSLSTPINSGGSILLADVVL